MSYSGFRGDRVEMRQIGSDIISMAHLAENPIIYHAFRTQERTEKFHAVLLTFHCSKMIGFSPYAVFLNHCNQGLILQQLKWKINFLLTKA